MKKKYIIISVLLLLLGSILLIGTKKNAPPVSYRDTANHFSITIPGNWTRTEGIAVERKNIGTAQETKQNIEIAQVFSKSNGLGITLQVYEGKPSCEDSLPSNTKLAGLPAHYDANRMTWTLDTTEAKFVIQAYYPGTGKFHLPPNTIRPTLPAQSVINADKKLLTTIIISTFKPRILKPLNCDN
jgi:hypothetical protein